MKKIITLFPILFCLSIFGYGASTPSHLPSVNTLIARIKHSSPAERKKALSLLKQKLKGIKKTERRTIMLKLRQALKSPPKHIPNRASEILGSFGASGDNSFGKSGQDGGSSGGHGGSGGDHGGGGHGGGGNGGGNGGR